jgi:LacI family transcriptional regulator
MADARPDALFCANDDLAAGALAALHEDGRSVPGDVALVGFDDRSSAQHLRPPLTTVALPLTAMGRRAGRLLLDAIAGRPVPPAIERLACRLIPRASSGR